MRAIFCALVCALLSTSFLRAAEVPWPAESFSSAVNLTGVEGPGTNDFHVDMSGTHWNPVTRRLWVCRNGGSGGSKFWALKENGDGGFEVDVRNGNRAEWSGFGDLEDITQANLNEDVVYVIIETEERIKEYDVSTYGTAVLRNSWNTAPHLPLSGGSGAEGIVFVPDSILTAAGFVDPAGNPRTSQNGMGGLMFVAHQNGGRIYVFDLNRSNGTFTYVGAYKTNYSESCALSLDRSDGLLYIFHGANHNRTEVTNMASVAVGGERQFVSLTTYAPPTGAASNANMEGIAVVSNDDCEDASRRFFLAVDGGGAQSLLMFTDFPCTQTETDEDGDGVEDEEDACPGTAAGVTLIADGCSCTQLGLTGPTISAQPSGGTVCSGQSRNLCVSATGTGTLSYQWQKESVNISGATSSCYAANTAGTYRCIISDQCGSTTSQAVSVTENTAPAVTSHPQSAVICTGDTRQFCVTASGTAPLTYQWQRNGSNISGATSSCYTTGVAGTYRCVITNGCGSATSASATLSLNAPPTISVQPISGGICSGGTYQFCVTATGSGPFTYQWQRNGANVSGGTSSCLTASSAGSYRCIVSNSCGSATSNTASLSVQATMLWYPDADDDGFGDASGTPLSGCSQPSGYVSNNLDCDDADALVNPNGADGCNEDRNCDGSFPPLKQWFRDADGDGFGDSVVSTNACGQPTGYVANNLDCDDANAGTHPGAAELCDAIDNDCDGMTDNLGDSDADGVSECVDLCPNTPDGASVDSDGCTCGQLSPGDDDDDGVPNCEDACQDSPAGVPVDANGCTCAQLDPFDDDGDGVENCADTCPNSPAGKSVDANGCTCKQLDPGDSDGDGVPNCNDQCPGTSRNLAVDATGCACTQLSNPDTDDDGVSDCDDLCPDTPGNQLVDADGCACTQLDPLDDDADGVGNCVDACPDTPADTEVDAQGCPVTEPSFPGGVLPVTPGTTGETLTTNVACGAGNTVSMTAVGLMVLMCSGRRGRRTRRN